MLAIAAGGALLLALVGIYGVVSYVVTERTFEIGIRIALGAQKGDVRRLFIRHGLALTFAGIVLGLGAAALLTPVMSALLYDVAPTDPLTYVGVATALAAATLLATYLPARRASLVEPDRDAALEPVERGSQTGDSSSSSIDGFWRLK